MHLLFVFVCECWVVGVPAWARATFDRGLETAEMGCEGELRPEGAFQRTQLRTQEVILYQRLNAFAICFLLRVGCGRCARLGARGARKRSWNGRSGLTRGNEARMGLFSAPKSACRR